MSGQIRGIVWADTSKLSNCYQQDKQRTSAQYIICCFNMTHTKQHRGQKKEKGERWCFNVCVVLAKTVCQMYLCGCTIVAVAVSRFTVSV